APAAPAEHDLGCQERRSQTGKAQQVQDEKGAAAVRADQIGEFPDVAETCRGPDQRQDENRLARPGAFAQAMLDGHVLFLLGIQAPPLSRTSPSPATRSAHLSALALMPAAP